MQWSILRYENRRQLLLRFCLYFAVIFLIFMLPYISISCGWKPWELFGTVNFAIANTAWMLISFLAMTIWGIWYYKVDAALQLVNEKAEVSPLPMNRIASWIDRFKGRCYRSQLHVWGAPVIDIQFGSLTNVQSPTKYKWARGWIAIGDVAVGRILAIGPFAIAPVAIGNISLGLFAVGTVSVAGLALGVMTCGILSSGLISLGVFSAGIVAVGYVARAILPIGVDCNPLPGQEPSPALPINPATRLSEYSQQWPFQISDWFQMTLSDLATSSTLTRCCLWGLIVLIFLLVYRYEKRLDAQDGAN